MKRSTDSRGVLIGTCLVMIMVLSPGVANSQSVFEYRGDPLPSGLDAMYVKGLKFLVETQNAQGCWADSYGSQPGVAGLVVLAILAHGDDPNYGPYARSVRKALDFIIKSTNKSTGYIGSSMYNHGFATLALAEAYGAVNDSRLGPALKKAIDMILSSQAKNSHGAWRYSPQAQDADTTVSGAQMVALFAARNAGIEVPDEAINKGLDYFRRCGGSDGGFGYTSRGSSSAPRAAIGALVFALAKDKSSGEFKGAMRYLAQSGDSAGGSYMHYYLYYGSQAHFHWNMSAWRKWNKINIKRQEQSQGPKGSWHASQGSTFGTSAALLSLALNYRFLPIYER